jgi:cytochrome P450
METNIASTEWAMSELVANPGVMARAQAELDAVVGRERLVHDRDMANLPYIKAIVKESMRFHPPIAFLPRKAIQATKAFGYDIPEGANVWVNMWGMGRLASIYPEPLRFNPDRFLPGGSNANLDLQGQSFELLPFGSGRRICPGLPVGYNMVQTGVATLLHAFSWTAPDNHSLMEGVGAATLYKATPLKALAKPRLSPHLYTPLAG